jgi:hypothetical protein
VFASPLTLPCGATLPNRIAKPAMSEGLADDDNAPTGRLTRLYRRRSDSGADPNRHPVRGLVQYLATTGVQALGGGETGVASSRHQAPAVVHGVLTVSSTYAGPSVMPMVGRHHHHRDPLPSSGEGVRSPSAGVPPSGNPADDLDLREPVGL